MRAAPGHPPTLPETADALRALLLAAWAERDSAVTERDHLAVERDALAEQNDRLRHLLLRLRRMQFGARSERLPEEQLQLGLESLEQAIAQGEAEGEQHDPALKRERVARRRASRGALPAHLPRIEVTLEPEDTACPCCRGAMAVIGHDSSERLDVIPARFRVLVTRRPKLACRACEGVVVQAPAPARLIEGGLPTEAMVAHVLVARYADHLPLYRQAGMMARQGVELDRSTLSFWMGYAAAEIAPVVARLREVLLASARVFADETVVPVLDPGRGRTKTGYFWAVARDDRPWGGGDPPAVAYSYAPGRGQQHNDRVLGAYRGILQCDGYATYKKLADPRRGEEAVTLVFCWSHVRRGFYDLAKAGAAPIAGEALARIAALYRIEAEVRGKAAAESHLASALGGALVENGYRVLFARTTDLVQRLQAARQELQLEGAISKLDRYDLLILDDLSYVRRDQAETSVLFKLILSRYERRSLLVTANHPFGAWDSVFPDKAMTIAAIDRLVHHSTILEMNVESYHRRVATARRRGKAILPSDTTGDANPAPAEPTPAP